MTESPSSKGEYFGWAYDAGARIHSNSWGDASNDYTTTVPPPGLPKAGGPRPRRAPRITREMGGRHLSSTTSCTSTRTCSCWSARPSALPTPTPTPRKRGVRARAARRA